MKAVKQFIVNTLYKIGDIISKTFYYKTPVLYRPYCYIMDLSYRLQVKWNLDEPWNTDF